MRKDRQRNNGKPEEFIGENIMELDEVVRIGAHAMIKLALEAEIKAYMDERQEELFEDGRQIFTRNGYHNERKITVGAGVVPVRVPRSRNRLGEDEHFISRLVPPFMRRSLKIEEAIPLLYLRGLSTGDFIPCLEKLFGKGVSGLSPANICRLKSVWKKEYTAWRKRGLSKKEYVYIWVDGIHMNVSQSDGNLSTLVVIGALENGKKELIAVEGGYRESSESWRALLRDLLERGLRCPRLFIGDGALGFWKAAMEVYPKAKWQRCWVHKTANVLDKLPKSVQAQAKIMIHDIYLAPIKADALKAYDKFMSFCDGRYSKAADCLEKDKKHLFTFYDFPSAHWKHIRTTNVIESPFATVRLRTAKTRGQGTNVTVLLMVYKLLEQASQRWQRLNGRHLLVKVANEVKFADGLELKAAA